MATFNTITDVSLTPEGKPASKTVTSHTLGTKISEGPTYTPPAPNCAGSTLYVDKSTNTKTVGTCK